MTTVNAIVAADVDFKSYKGDTFRTTLTFTDANGSAIDLSAASLKMECYNGRTLILSFSNGDGITVSGAGNNIVTLQKVITIQAGNFRYDLQATLQDGTIVTYIKGNFLVQPDITQ